MVIPCNNHFVLWSQNDKEKLIKLLKEADKVRILSNEYYEGCMLDRNRYLIDNSLYLICYKRNEKGGTAYTERYAKEKQKKIIYL